MSDGIGDNKWIPKEEGPQAASERIVWSTRQIDDLLVAMDQGYRPKIKLPFYEGRQFLKKGNIVFEYTDEEISELARCAKDIVYFAEKYAVVMTDEGIQQVTLRDYQKEMLRNFQNDRFNIVLAARQMGKTVTASIFNAWYVTFNMDKNTLLLANKSDSTKEIIDKAKTVIENLPFFMKPGIIKYDVMNVRCDNGCRLIGQSTTAKSGIGFTIHNLYLDEFAHVHPSIADSFYENVYPTLSSSKVSRITITSTPNGFNKFYQIYAAADRGDNEYLATRIDWWQHPDRDEAWYERELANLGSIEAFNKQYPMPEHPVIRTHPDTKKKVIYVNAAFTQYIKDWDSEESQQMLNFLYSRASVPEYQCRFAWQDNSIAFWDNRACQHYANSDYWPNVRKVERVTIIGDRPY